MIDMQAEAVTGGVAQNNDQRVRIGQNRS